MNDNIQQFFHILYYLVPQQLPSFLFIPKFIFGLVGIFFAVFIVFALIKSSWLWYLFFLDAREFLTYRAFGVRKFTRDWEKIAARLETGEEAEFKLALIEADSMLDNSLKRLGFGGDTLQEKLDKTSSAILPNVADIKEAHRVRDNIVHDPNFILSHDQARKTLEVYEKSFQILDLI